MGTLGRIALVVIVISFFTFVALFGRLPALRKTPIGFLQRLLCDHIPGFLQRCDNTLTGGKTTASLTGMFNYLMYKKNPVVLVVFLGLVTGSASLFLMFTYDKLSARQLLPIPVLLLAPYVFTYLCVVDTSIYITPQNHRVRLHDYPFDNVLFHPDTICSTCNLVKPARSKHCSLCNACVSRSDHHCPWVNNCLGRTNYRWFLALLLSLFVLESYGAFLSFSLLSPYLLTSGSEIAGQSLFSTAYWSNVGDKVARAVNEGGLSTAGVGMLSASTAPLPLGLLAYHIYLVWAGMTTNETQKWADWREDMADGVVFRAKYSEVLAREQELKAQRLRTGDGQAFASGREMAPLVDWPVASNQHVVRTNDGRPPNGREHLYEQIWSLNAVDNIYDLGLWDNFMYVLKGR